MPAISESHDEPLREMLREGLHRTDDSRVRVWTEFLPMVNERLTGQGLAAMTMMALRCWLLWKAPNTFHRMEKASEEAPAIVRRVRIPSSWGGDL